jgi:3-phosphoshikimate 1-carboxyvinyltransferase
MFWAHARIDVVAKQTVQPARSVSGIIEVPGDKSISHRYAILAGLARGRSEISHYSGAADCQSTLDCLERLGVGVERCARNGGAQILIAGAGIDGLRAAQRWLDAGNSGTTMRLMTGVLAGQPFDSMLTGDWSLRRRPMRRVIEPLERMGAHIQAREANFAPLEITGSALRPIQYALPVASAQVKSAVLLAGLFAEGQTSVEESVRTRDHTEVALQEFGAEVRRVGQVVTVFGRPQLEGRRAMIPGDLSSAVFFLAAAAILRGSNLLIHNVGLNPTRSAVLDVLSEWGAPVKIVGLRGESGELIGDVSVQYAGLSGGTLSGERIAPLIDELPMLAALGPYTEQGLEIRDAAELRVKESDRIAVLADNLQRMGAQVEERPDGLRIEGRGAGRLRGAEIDPRGDHRMAMAFAVAALGAEGRSVIRDSDCVGISYPDFFEVLEHSVER